jgi:site-specific recombinase XerD
MFAAGIDVKVIQQRVGHSGSKMTRDYAAVGEEVYRAAAEKAASLISRKAAR